MPQQSYSQDGSAHRQAHNKLLSQQKILQRCILYVIGIAPSIAREDTLRKFEYFGQYGRVLNLKLGKPYQAETQLCYSAYVTYSQEKEAAIGLISVDQNVFDGRLMHASFGRTKYCRFFLKNTGCMNQQCPYLHKEAQPEYILQATEKKLQFQQCFQIALKLSKITLMQEHELRNFIKQHKEHMMSIHRLKEMPQRMGMPSPDVVIFEKKQLAKLHCKQQFDLLEKHEERKKPQRKTSDCFPTLKCIDQRLVNEDETTLTGMADTALNSQGLTKEIQITKIIEPPSDPFERPRSGSHNQRRIICPELDEDAGTHTFIKRRNSSHSRFRVLDNLQIINYHQQNSPIESKFQERMLFTEQLRQALQQAAMDERDSTGQFSSIFTDSHITQQNFRWEQKLNCSERPNARLNSPIRESLIDSPRSRGSNRVKQRSQHSLIIESVARILDDSALEDRVHKQLIENTCRTGPLSVVRHNFINNIYSQHIGVDTDIDEKWQSYFEAQSQSQSSIHTPSLKPSNKTFNRINSQINFGSTPPAQFSSSGFYQPTYLRQQTSGSMLGRGQMMWKSKPVDYSAYSTGNTQQAGYFHNSFHKNNTSLQYNNIEPFNLKDNRSHNVQHNLQTKDRRSPKMQFQSSIQSVVIPQQQMLTQANLEILNKQHCPSKDMLYAKIFTDFDPEPGITHVKNKNGYSAQLLTPQSLFCFALGRDDSEDLMARRRRLTRNNEFESSRVLADKLRRKSVTKNIAKQEIPAIDLHNQAYNQKQLTLQASQTVQQLALDSNNSEDDQKEMEQEKRDNVDDGSFQNNFFKEFQKVNESLRRSSQAKYGSSIFFDKSQKQRKRSQSLGRETASPINASTASIIIGQDGPISRRNSDGKLEALNS